MFDDATFESQGRIHTRSRRWMLATFLLNSGILTTLILIPLLHPYALPRQLTNTILTAPSPPPSMPHVATSSQSHASASAAQISVPLNNTRPQIALNHSTADASSAEPSSCFNCETIPGSNGVIGADSDIFRSKPPEVRPAQEKPKGPVPISRGVATGMLIQKTQPIYPPIAKAARIEGTVTLVATISKTGTIEGLRVVSGPPMLASAAMSAVQTWRYRPYLLSGDPVEVETTIQVIFSLSQ